MHITCIFENKDSTLCETKNLNLGNSEEIKGNSWEIRWKAFQFFQLVFPGVKYISLLGKSDSPDSTGILGFEMEKNTIKLKISRCVQNVLLYYLWKVPKFPLSGTSFFLTKFTMATKRHVKVVIPELFTIYFDLIHHFHMIFNAEFISESVSNF